MNKMFYITVSTVSVTYFLLEVVNHGIIQSVLLPYLISLGFSAMSINIAIGASLFATILGISYIIKKFLWSKLCQQAF